MDVLAGQMLLTGANFQLTQKIFKKHGVQWSGCRASPGKRKFLAIGGFNYKKPGGNPLTTHPIDVVEESQA
eukprot:4244883-Amphidinium_carterae.1